MSILSLSFLKKLGIVFLISTIVSFLFFSFTSSESENESLLTGIKVEKTKDIITLKDGLLDYQCNWKNSNCIFYLNGKEYFQINKKELKSYFKDNSICQKSQCFLETFPGIRVEIKNLKVCKNICDNKYLY